MNIWLHFMNTDTADRLFFSSWKLWIMNMQPTVFWYMNRCGLILKFTQQVRPNHWHPITHLLNYTASFPRRSKSYLYQHSINISSRNLTGHLTESCYIQTQNHVAMLTLVIWTALIRVIIISETYLRLTRGLE